jgi:hypothetical protein
MSKADWLTAAASIVVFVLVFWIFFWEWVVDRLW